MYVNPKTSDVVKVLDFNIKNDHIAPEIAAQTDQTCPQNAGNTILDVEQIQNFPGEHASVSPS